MIPNKNTFCIAPFQSVTVIGKGELKICCISSEKKFEHKYHQLEKWYKSDTLNNLRKNLITGVKDPICQRCWLKEAVNSTSQRQLYNKHIAKILPDHWEKSFTKNKKLLDVISNIDHKNIVSFDLTLGNLCNLKCIMCNSHNSSQLIAEVKLNPSLQQFNKLDNQQDYNWPEKKDFVDWCRTFLGSAIHLKFLGGEPMMNPYLIQVLESIPDEQKKKCILHLTTNLTTINQKIIDVFSKFKETWLQVSVEGTGRVLEYARFPHKWNDLEKNLLFLKRRLSKNIHMDVNMVIQAPTFAGLFDTVKYFDNLKLKIEALPLEKPECFKLLSIKKHVKEQFLNQTKDYNDFNKLFVQTVRGVVEKYIMHDPILAKQCVYRLRSFDQVRKNNFEDIIPIDYFI